MGLRKHFENMGIHYATYVKKNILKKKTLIWGACFENGATKGENMAYIAGKL